MGAKKREQIVTHEETWAEVTGKCEHDMWTDASIYEQKLHESKGDDKA